MKSGGGWRVPDGSYRIELKRPSEKGGKRIKGRLAVTSKSVSFSEGPWLRESYTSDGKDGIAIPLPGHVIVDSSIADLFISDTKEKRIPDSSESFYIPGGARTEVVIGSPRHASRRVTLEARSGERLTLRVGNSDLMITNGPGTANWNVHHRLEHGRRRRWRPSWPRPSESR